MPARSRHTTRAAKPTPARRGRQRPSGPWKHGPLPVIGLVGSIGAGKSTAADWLASRGAHVLDADRVGHALLEQSPTRRLVLERFGPDIADPADASRIDRAALGRVVFAAPKALADLERILHPRMRSTFAKAIAREQRRRRAKAIVLDAAVLFEAGWDDLCDLVVFVDAPRALRLERVAATRGWSAGQLEARERAQWPLDRKRAAAQVVVTNAGPPVALAEALDPLWSHWTERPKLGRAVNTRTAQAATPSVLTSVPDPPSA
jgi:dephospho-CoA kinase